MLSEFRQFLLRGNVLDLAIAVIIGAAFGAITKSLVDDVIMQIIAAIGGAPDFAALVIPIGRGAIKIGAFINTVVNFVIIAAVLFFFIIKPMNAMMARAARQTAESAPPAPTKEEVLLTEIRDALRSR